MSMIAVPAYKPQFATQHLKNPFCLLCGSFYRKKSDAFSPEMPPQTKGSSCVFFLKTEGFYFQNFSTVLDGKCRSRGWVLNLFHNSFVGVL